MSEGSSQLFTQPFFPPDSSTYSDGDTILGCGLTQEKKDAANKPRFVDFACSHSEVGVRRFEIFRTLIAHDRSPDMPCWLRKRLYRRRFGEGKRTLVLSNVVSDMALGCQYPSDLIEGDRHPGVHRVAKIRDHFAASRSARDQDLEV